MTGETLKKYVIPLNSPLESSLAETVVSAERPTFQFNQQIYAAGMLQNMVTFEADGLFSDWYRNDWTIKIIGPITITPDVPGLSTDRLKLMLTDDGISSFSFNYYGEVIPGFSSYFNWSVYPSAGSAFTLSRVSDTVMRYTGICANLTGTWTLDVDPYTLDVVSFTRSYDMADTYTAAVTRNSVRGLDIDIRKPRKLYYAERADIMSVRVYSFGTSVFYNNLVLSSVGYASGLHTINMSQSKNNLNFTAAYQNTTKGTMIVTLARYENLSKREENVIYQMAALTVHDVSIINYGKNEEIFRAELSDAVLFAQPWSWMAGFGQVDTLCEYDLKGYGRTYKSTLKGSPTSLVFEFQLYNIGTSETPIMGYGDFVPNVEILTDQTSVTDFGQPTPFKKWPEPYSSYSNHDDIDDLGTPENPRPVYELDPMVFRLRWVQTLMEDISIQVTKLYEEDGSVDILITQNGSMSACVYDMLQIGKYGYPSSAGIGIGAVNKNSPDNSDYDIFLNAYYGGRGGHLGTVDAPSTPIHVDATSVYYTNTQLPGSPSNWTTLYANQFPAKQGSSLKLAVAARSKYGMNRIWSSYRMFEWTEGDKSWTGSGFFRGWEWSSPLTFVPEGEGVHGYRMINTPATTVRSELPGVPQGWVDSYESGVLLPDLVVDNQSGYKIISDRRSLRYDNLGSPDLYWMLYTFSILPSNYLSFNETSWTFNIRYDPTAPTVITYYEKIRLKTNGGFDYIVFESPAPLLPPVERLVYPNFAVFYPYYTWGGIAYAGTWLSLVTPIPFSCRFSAGSSTYMLELLKSFTYLDGPGSYTYNVSLVVDSKTYDCPGAVMNIRAWAAGTEFRPAYDWVLHSESNPKDTRIGDGLLVAKYFLEDGYLNTWLRMDYNNRGFPEGTVINGWTYKPSIPVSAVSLSGRYDEWPETSIKMTIPVVDGGQQALTAGPVNENMPGQQSATISWSGPFAIIVKDILFFHPQRYFNFIVGTDRYTTDSLSKPFLCIMMENISHHWETLAGVELFFALPQGETWGVVHLYVAPNDFNPMIEGTYTRPVLLYLPGTPPFTGYYPFALAEIAFDYTLPRSVYGKIDFKEYPTAFYDVPYNGTPAFARLDNTELVEGFKDIQTGLPVVTTRTSLLQNKDGTADPWGVKPAAVYRLKYHDIYKREITLTQVTEDDPEVPADKKSFIMQFYPPHFKLGTETMRPFCEPTVYALQHGSDTTALMIQPDLQKIPSNSTAYDKYSGFSALNYDIVNLDRYILSKTGKAGEGIFSTGVILAITLENVFAVSPLSGTGFTPVFGQQFYSGFVTNIVCSNTGGSWSFNEYKWPKKIGKQVIYQDTSITHEQINNNEITVGRHTAELRILNKSNPAQTVLQIMGQTNTGDIRLDLSSIGKNTYVTEDSTFSTFLNYYDKRHYFLEYGLFGIIGKQEALAPSVLSTIIMSGTSRYKVVFGGLKGTPGFSNDPFILVDLGKVTARWDASSLLPGYAPVSANYVETATLPEVPGLQLIIENRSFFVAEGACIPGVYMRDGAVRQNPLQLPSQITSQRLYKIPFQWDDGSGYKDYTIQFGPGGSTQIANDLTDVRTGVQTQLLMGNNGNAKSVVGHTTVESEVTNQWYICDGAVLQEINNISCRLLFSRDKYSIEPEGHWEKGTEILYEDLPKKGLSDFPGLAYMTKYGVFSMDADRSTTDVDSIKNAFYMVYFSSGKLCFCIYPIYVDIDAGVLTFGEPIKTLLPVSKSGFTSYVEAETSVLYTFEYEPSLLQSALSTSAFSQVMRGSDLSYYFGIRLDSGLNQWVIHIGSDGEVLNIIYGYGCIGVNGIVTGGVFLEGTVTGSKGFYGSFIEADKDGYTVGTQPWAEDLRPGIGITKPTFSVHSNVPTGLVGLKKGKEVYYLSGASGLVYALDNFGESTASVPLHNEVITQVFGLSDCALSGELFKGKVVVMGVPTPSSGPGYTLYGASTSCSLAATNTFFTRTSSDVSLAIRVRAGALAYIPPFMVAANKAAVTSFGELFRAGLGQVSQGIDRLVANLRSSSDGKPGQVEVPSSGGSDSYGVSYARTSEERLLDIVNTKGTGVRMRPEDVAGAQRELAFREAKLRQDKLASKPSTAPTLSPEPGGEKSGGEGKELAAQQSVSRTLEFVGSLAKSVTESTDGIQAIAGSQNYINWCDLWSFSGDQQVFAGPGFTNVQACQQITAGSGFGYSAQSEGGAYFPNLTGQIMNKILAIVPSIAGGGEMPTETHLSDFGQKKTGDASILPMTRTGDNNIQLFYPIEKNNMSSFEIDTLSFWRNENVAEIGVGTGKSDSKKFTFAQFDMRVAKVSKTSDRGVGLILGQTPLLGTTVEPMTTSLPFAEITGGPTFTAPNPYDFIIRPFPGLRYVTVGEDIVAVTIDSVNVLDGPPTNIIATSNKVLLASTYAFVKGKLGVNEADMRYRKVATAGIAIAGYTGGNNTMLGPLSRVGGILETNRVVSAVSSGGQGVTDLTAMFVSPEERGVKLAGILPPSRFLGVFTGAFSTENSRYVKVISSVIGNVAQSTENLYSVRIPVPRTYAREVSTPAFMQALGGYSLLIFDGITSLVTDIRTTSPYSKRPVLDTFVLNNQTYEMSTDFISSVTIEEGIQMARVASSCNGLSYVGFTTSEAYLWSPSLLTFYTFSRSLETASAVPQVTQLDSCYRFTDVYHGAYDFVGQELIMHVELDGEHKAFIRRKNDFLGMLPYPPDTINQEMFEFYSVNGGFVVQGRDRFVLYRPFAQDYMNAPNLDLIKNRGKWYPMPGDSLEDFWGKRDYGWSFDVTSYNAPSTKFGSAISGYYLQPFKLCTSYLGIQDNMDGVFEWVINFYLTKTLANLMGDRYVVVNLASETMCPGGIVKSEVTHVYLTVDKFDRRNGNGYYTFRFNGRNGAGNAEKLYIWSDGCVAIRDITLEILPTSEQRTAPLMTRVDVQGLEQF